MLSLLAAALPESPGSQFALHALGGTRLLLTLLRSPSNSPSLGLSAIHVLSLLANKHSPGALAEVTAGGLVAVVMNVLQQQAMAGVLVSEVSMFFAFEWCLSGFLVLLVPQTVHTLDCQPFTNSVCWPTSTSPVLWLRLQLGGWWRWQ